MCAAHIILLISYINSFPIEHFFRNKSMVDKFMRKGTNSKWGGNGSLSFSSLLKVNYFHQLFETISSNFELLK